MFGRPNPQKVPRAVPQTGELVPFGIPFRGIDARSPFAVMGPEHAVTLVNVIPESYGLRTRKGYTEYATGLPLTTPIPTLLSYYPASATPAPSIVGSGAAFSMAQFVLGSRRISPLDATPPGKLFAAQDGFLYDVTNAGAGPRVAEAGVTGNSDYWNYANIQNPAGSFLCVTNEAGGYWIYNGTSWTKVVAGDGTSGTISGVDPDKFVFVVSWKKRLWFIEKDSTRAWYLPVEQLTGIAKLFDFGTQMPHGGSLAALAGWTVDGGDGMDDHLVAVGYQGDVVIYKGIDPDTVNEFVIHGTWFCGPLPAGRRNVTQDGGDVYILSQLGLLPLSKLLTATSLSAELQQHVSYLIDPIVASLMRSYANVQGWQTFVAAKEELVLIGIPASARVPYGSSYLAYKTTTKAWSLLTGTNYVSFAAVGATIFAGTADGRVVLAFEGNLDNITVASPEGIGIQCQVTPAYQPMTQPGMQKRFCLVRPSFLAASIPSAKVTVLVDYEAPGYGTYPSLPVVLTDKWDLGFWDIAKWGGLKIPIKEWFGIVGTGFAATVQLDYTAAGDTLLTTIDWWVELGGPL